MYRSHRRVRSTQPRHKKPLNILKRHTPLVATALAVLMSMVAWVTISPQAGAADLGANIDWSMPDRTKTRFASSGATDMRMPTPEFLNPSSWTVRLNGCGSSPTARLFHWEIDLPDRVQVIDATSCDIDITVPTTGKYRTKLTVTDAAGQKATTIKRVNVRDFLVVSMGDSFGSGEGNPDEVSSFGPIWGDRRCHRSGHSGPAQAALRLERADPRSSVTFVSVACSGASIFEGLIHPYDGQEPLLSEPLNLDPQILAVSRLLCPGGCASKNDLRPIDALLLQVGANDLHFGQLVADCARPRPLTDCSVDIDVTGRLNRDLAALPGSFDALARQLDDWLPINAVFAGEYFDPTRADNGDFCPEMNMVRDFALDGQIVYSEAHWAYHHVMTPLNNEVRAATQRHSDKNWRYVGGISDLFRTHGYCAANAWIVNYTQSFAQQGNEDGTMHPNRLGHDAYANALVANVRPMFKF